MKLLDVALRILAEEEVARQLREEARRLRQPYIIRVEGQPVVVGETVQKKTRIIKHKMVKPPLVLADVHGSGRLVEAVIKFSAGEPIIGLLVDGEQHIYTLDEIMDISSYTEDIIYVDEEAYKVIALKNICFSNRLYIKVNQVKPTLLEEAYAKIEVEETIIPGTKI